MHCTMKTFIYSLMTIVLLGFTSCDRTGHTQQIVTEQATAVEKPLSIEEELLQAHELFRQAGKIKDADMNNSQNQQRSLKIYDQAIYHYANVVVREDSNDSLRIVALHIMRWIEAYQKRNYGVALQYLNQCIALTSENHPYYVLNLAHKADDLWHIEERDSAIYYAKLALQLPHKHQSIDYICSHVLWQVYKELGVRDSAEHYQQFYFKVRDGKLYKEQTMDELIDELKNNVIANGKPEVKEDVRASEAQKRDPQFKAQKRHQRVYRILLLLILLSPFAINYYRKHYRRRHLAHEEPQSPPSGNEPIAATTEEDKETFSLPETLILRRSLADGRRAFESTTSYEELNTMQIKEKELYDMAYEATRDVESTLFESFKEACSTLHEGLELNDQELVCCFCTYLGYSNNVIAYIGHTTPTTIRKRKERIRKKLPTDLYEVIFGEKG